MGANCNRYWQLFKYCIHSFLYSPHSPQLHYHFPYEFLREMTHQTVEIGSFPSWENWLTLVSLQYSLGFSVGMTVKGSAKGCAKGSMSQPFWGQQSAVRTLERERGGAGKGGGVRTNSQFALCLHPATSSMLHVAEGWQSSLLHSTCWSFSSPLLQRLHTHVIIIQEIIWQTYLLPDCHKQL